MKSKITLMLLVLVSLSINANAQDKIGYINFQTVLMKMPEAKLIDQSLDAYQKELTNQAQAREQAVTVYYNSVVQKMDRGELSPKQQQDESVKLEKMQNDLTESYAEDEFKLAQKRTELLTPVLDKIQKVTKQVAVENGYTFILNSVDSNGASTIIYGPENRDITEQVLKKLGIK